LCWSVPRHCSYVSLDLIGARMKELVVAAGAIGHAKLQSNLPYRHTSTQLFTGRIPFLSPNQQCRSTEGRKYYIPRTCSPQAHLGLPSLSLPLRAPCYFGGGRVAKPLVSYLTPAPIVKCE